PSTIAFNTPTTTITGPISGTGALVKAGTGNLVLAGSDTHTGVIVATAGGLVVTGALPNTSVGVAGATLSGTGVTGPLAFAPGAADTPGNPGNTRGIQSAATANFSEGGNLTVQVSGFSTPGVDYDRLDLGSGALLVGGGNNGTPAT